MSLTACLAAAILTIAVPTLEAAKGRPPAGKDAALPVSLSYLQTEKFKDASRVMKTEKSFMAFYEDLGFSYMAGFRGDKVTALKAIYDLRPAANDSMRALFNFHASTLGMLHPGTNFAKEKVSAMFDRCEPEIKAVYSRRRPKGACSFEKVRATFRRDDSKFYLDYNPER